MSRPNSNSHNAMTTLRPSDSPVFLRTCARRKIENIRRHRAAKRFSPKVVIMGSIFLLSNAAIICYALVAWYK